jgi:transposase
MPTSIPPVQSNSPGDESRSRDELLAEVKQLRMENDYLKKLEALVQEKKRVAQQKKRKS